MKPQLRDLLSVGTIEKGIDGIYSSTQKEIEPNKDQNLEQTLRHQVASRKYSNYLHHISISHSIPVMDYEIDSFLSKIPCDGLILDIGGCWGWHWRHLSSQRRDVGVVIVDFVRQNLAHAQKILHNLLEQQVILLHADAISLPFPSTKAMHCPFDGIWTVQTFQHIPNFEKACKEAHRVCKRFGIFKNYTLNSTPMNRAIYKLFNKEMHLNGIVNGNYYLRRSDIYQRDIVARIFGTKVLESYTECLFHPDLKLSFTGREKSRIGRIDAHLGRFPALGRWIGRQHSLEAVKA